LSRLVSEASAAARHGHRRSPCPYPTSARPRPVLNHPTHHLPKPTTGRSGDIGHKRRRGHAGLRVDLQPDESLLARKPLVIAKVRARSEERRVGKEGRLLGCKVGLKIEDLYLKKNRKEREVVK